MTQYIGQITVIIDAHDESIAKIQLTAFAQRIQDESADVAFADHNGDVENYDELERECQRSLKSGPTGNLRSPAVKAPIGGAPEQKGNAMTTLPPFPPGPYRYQRSTNGLDDTVDVYAPGIEHFLFSIPFSDEADQAEALARVFTASPNLLSACRFALAAMEAALEANDPQARTQIDWESEPLVTLRAAIREAEAPFDPLFAYLDANSIKFEEFGCFVSLSEDNRTIYWCPALADGRPEPADYFDARHMNWGEVTAPEPEFLDRVNSLFGTAFQPEQFAGR